MHETVIARDIIEKAKEQGKVNAIRLEIGELGHVPAEELLACVRQLVPWRVDYTLRESQATCSQCGFTGRPTIIEHGHDFFIIECPRCGAVPDVTDGTEVKLLSVEVA